MIKSITLPNGRSARFGRHRPVTERPQLRLKNYLRKSLPSPPDAVDYSTLAMAALTEVYENDTLGDCVIAAQAHLVGIFTANANAGSPVIFTDDQIISRYSAIGGYVPGDPSTDNGCSMATALYSWQFIGMMPDHPKDAKHKIAGSLSVDPSNVEEMQSAIWLFENLDIGMDLPDAWVNPSPSASGFTWDVAGPPDPENGHDVAGFGYNTSGVIFDTWGMIGTLTWAAIAEYAQWANGGELYTVISHDMIERAQQIAPNGFNWQQLLADFASLT